MSALLEYECQVPVGGYDVITLEYRSILAPEKIRMLQPRSKRTRRLDLFEVSPFAFLEFAQTPLTEDGIKDFADRYGPLADDQSDPTGGGYQWGRSIRAWSGTIREMHRTIELWQKSMVTGDFSKFIRAVQISLIDPAHYDSDFTGVPVKLRLKEDPLSPPARLCICPHSLFDALWAQIVLAIDGNLNLRACVQCRKWFTLEAGRGRSDKEYCSNACRMRAYRKRKVNG
jgi:hypothetical protein